MNQSNMDHKVYFTTQDSKVSVGGTMLPLYYTYNLTTRPSWRLGLLDPERKKRKLNLAPLARRKRAASRCRGSPRQVAVSIRDLASLHRVLLSMLTATRCSCCVRGPWSWTISKMASSILMMRRTSRADRVSGGAENESIPPSLARWFAPLLSCEVLLMIYACKAAAQEDFACLQCQCSGAVKTIIH